MVIISTIFIFITLTTTLVLAVVCCKRNAVFALSSQRRRRQGNGRRASKSTCSAGSGSRDCEHCEIDQWRYSATAIADSSEDEGEEVDSPIFDVEVFFKVTWTAAERNISRIGYQIKNGNVRHQRLWLG